MDKLNLNPFGLSEQSYDFRALAQMRVDAYNATPGTRTECDCPQCRNRGTIAFLREDGSFCVRDCACIERRRSLRQAERSGLGPALKNCTFDNFQTPELWQRNAKAGVMDYAREGEGWLLLCGQSGSGKTHLCAAVCGQRIRRGESVLCLTWRDTMGALKAACKSDSDTEETLSRYKQAKLLFLDDLYKVGGGSGGVPMPSSAEIGWTFDIINYRYNHRLPTIVSTERMPGELRKIDEATAGRILQMAGRHIYVIDRNDSRNFRLKRGAAPLSAPPRRA